MARIDTVVTDLDNTLYDWVALWYASFSAMLAKLVEISNVPQAELEREIRPIFQRRHTSEYSFVIQEIPSLQRLHPGEDLTVVYRDAIEAYREARDNALSLYPTVEETLHALKAKGCAIAGYTESLAWYSRDRVRRLGLDGVLDFLYSPEDHEIPEGVSVEQLRRFPDGHYELKETVHRRLPLGVKKPNPEVLADILAEIGADPERSIYIGDSLMKDIAMAQDAGITDVYAAYGRAQHLEEYELLRRVSHWSEEDVQREKQLMERPTVTPTYTLKEEMAEVLDVFEFGGAQCR